jgi:hypothetical protein
MIYKPQDERCDSWGITPKDDGGFHSWDNFKRRDLVAFEFEEESKIDGTAGKVAGEPACDDRPPVRSSAREWLARVLILGRNIRLPLLDRGPA